MTLYRSTRPEKVRKAFYYMLYYTNCYNLQEVMSQQSQQRKTRVLINEETFDLVKRLYKIKSKKKLLEITNLSISTLNNLIRKIESHEGEELSFSNIYKKSGRNKKDESELYTEIRSIMGNDNSLTLKICQKK